MTEKSKSGAQKVVVPSKRPAQSPNTHGYVPADIPEKPSSSSTTTGQGSSGGDGDGKERNNS